MDVRPRTPRVSPFALLLVWSACGATEGPLFRARDAGSIVDADVDPDVDAEVAADAGSGPVRPGMRLQYQLAGALDLSAQAELFVVDLFETSPDAVARLHAQGRVVVAFLAAGSYEPWRPDVRALPASAIGEPLASYPEESWLDVREPSVRSLMEGRLTQAVDKGFDGVLLASLDGYAQDSGHDYSAEDQLAYDVWLAGQASARGLSVGVSSDWARATQLAQHFDFAIHLNCLANGRCGELAPYRARGAAVFDLETGDDAEVCDAAAGLALPVTRKNDNFDAWLATCP